MKYAALVFRNIHHAAEDVGYGTVVNALLSGGVPLSEIVLLPYDDPSATLRVLRRLRGECDGAFLICDDVLLPAAREAVSAVTGAPFTGTLYADGGCLFAVLPAGEAGRRLAEREVLPETDRRRGQSYRSIVIRTVAAPAERMRAALEAAQEASEDKLQIHVSGEYGIGRTEIVYNRNTPKVVCDETVRILMSELEPYVYAMEDVEIAERLFTALKLHRMKISTAESFTGGGVGQAIVSRPGASAVFYEGVNAYDNNSKAERLGVSEYTLRTKGAVSSETAYEMAAGLLGSGHCDVAVATTGIAGPESDGSGKPVGLCYIAVGTKERVRVFEYHLEGDRESVTRQAINLALFLTYREIN